MKNEFFVSHSPVRQNKLNVWFKSVKTTKGIGGRIVANAFGQTKNDAEDLAKKIAGIPVMIEMLTKIADWDSFKDHPIGRYAQTALDAIK